MKFFDFYRSKPCHSAQTAKQRLQLLVAHERILTRPPSYLSDMQQELVEVVRRFLPVNEKCVHVEMDRECNGNVRVINISLPGDSPEATESNKSGQAPHVARTERV